MVYDRYSQYRQRGDYDTPGSGDDFGRDYGSGRDYTYSSARDYQAAGALERNRDTGRDYGPREYGNSRYEQRGGYDGGYGQQPYGRDRQRDDYGARQSYGQQSYGQQRSGGYRDDPRDRGFFDRAGDEIRSWFGDEEAERRRERDQRYDEQRARDDDPHYHSWRREQIASLDRDYDEYRREHREKFNREFGSWRDDRQGQRSSLSRVNEHMDVVGSDGEHVGTVDKVRGDRIILTKSDSDAGGRHHSIPSRWLQQVDDKVTLRKTAEEAQAHWRDEERNQALFGDDRSQGGTGGNGDRFLSSSFSGTY